MNEDQIKGNWKQIKGKMKEKWGRLTENEILESEGKRDYLIGLIQERYGKTKDGAVEDVKNFFKELDE